MQLLASLARGSAPTQLDLARGIGLDKTRLIAVLDELERKRLVTRTPDPHDRRARVVSATTRGLTRHAEVVAEIRRLEESLTASLVPRDRQALPGILAALRERLQAPGS